VSLAGRARREPFGALLVAANLALASFLIYRHAIVRRGPPPGPPDVSAPAGVDAHSPTRGAADDLALTGVVTASPAFARRMPKGAFVFVIARGENGGPPYAVRRYKNPSLPLAWSLGPENVMIEGAPQQRLIVGARVDQDGDPMTHQLGDLESAPSDAVPPRAAVALVIDREAPFGP
jgi:hypothetical protein